MKKYLFKLLVSVIILIGITAGYYLLGFSKNSIPEKVGESHAPVIPNLSAALETNKTNKTNRTIMNDGVTDFTNSSVWNRQTPDRKNLVEKNIADEGVVWANWNYTAFDPLLSIENEKKLYGIYDFTVNGVIISCNGTQNPDTCACRIGVDNNAGSTGDPVSQANTDSTNIVSPDRAKTGQEQSYYGANYFEWIYL